MVGTLDASTPHPEACPANQKYFYAYDAPAGSNAMGPKLEVTPNQEGLEKAVTRFWTKGVCDPLWAAHAEEGLTVDNPADYDAARAQARGEEFNSNRNAWQDAVEPLATDEITGYELRDYGTTRYDSLGMIPDPSGDHSKMPTLTKWSEQPELHLVLVVKTKHHGERLFRLDCDLQFSAPLISKVPPAPPVTHQPTCSDLGNCWTNPPTTHVPTCEESGTCPTTTSPPPTTTPPPPTTTPPPPTTTPPAPKDPNEGPKTSIVMPAPTQAPETAPPVETNPMIPEVPITAPVQPTIVAPSATPLPPRTEVPPVPSDVPQEPSSAPAPSAISDPGES